MRRAVTITLGLLLGAPIVAVLFLVSGHLLEPRAAPPPPPAESRDARWRQDVEYLARELPRLHANAFHAISRDSFQQTIATLVAEIPSLDDGAIQVRLAQLVAAIGDGHTSMSPRPSGELVYPIRLRSFRDGIFVVRSDSGYSRLLQAELLGVDSLPISDALGRVADVISRDESVTVGLTAPGFLNSSTVLHTLGIAPRKDSASFLLRLPSRDTVRVVLPATAFRPTRWQEPPFPRPLYLQRPTEASWLEYLPDSRTVYVRYNHCSDPLGFWRVSRRLRQVLAEHPVDRAIIDFRGNSGGNSFQFHYLMLPVLRDAAVNRPGHLYALVDRATFSSASTNAAQLRGETAARLAGELPGGHPNGFGEVRSFRLPNSGITVWYSSKFLAPASPAGKDPGLVPDTEVALTSRDFFEGQDPVLSAVLAGPPEQGDQ